MKLLKKRGLKAAIGAALACLLGGGAWSFKVGKGREPLLEAVGHSVDVQYRLLTHERAAQKRAA